MSKNLVECSTCKKYFEKKPSRVKRSKNHYCCISCRFEGQKIDPEEKKQHIKEYNKQWRNRPEVKKKRNAYNKEYARNNKEKIKRLRIEWYKKNKIQQREKVKLRYRENLEENRVKNNKRQKQWKKDNPDKALLQRIKYYSNNINAKITQRLYQEKKRAKKYGCKIGNEKKLRKIYTEILITDKTICYYCEEECGKIVPGYGKDITIDHKNPISRKGDHDINNIVGCCRNCNSKKGNKTEKEYIAYKTKIEKLIKGINNE